MKPTISLTRIVQDFFRQHLVAERDLSPHTVLSYRDCLRLLLKFIGQSLQRSADQITLDDIDAARVRAFLDTLERERGCSSNTRNQRLAAIRTFFRYVASVSPEHLDRCRQIRTIFRKRIPHQAVSYLEPGEIEAVLAGIDLQTRFGLRDLTLLTLIYNTGARVQEVVDLDVADIRFSVPPRVRLKGKGRKQRDCPLWTQTVQLLRRLLSSRRLAEDAREPLFTNARGHRLTRHGVAYILRRATLRVEVRPSTTRLPHGVTPHVIRHTTAMQLLRADVDITTIAAWLGHADLRTTHQYVEIDLRMKNAAMVEPTTILGDSIEPVELDSTLIAWLDALG